MNKQVGKIKKNAKGTSMTLLAAVLGLVGMHAASNALPQHKLLNVGTLVASALGHTMVDNQFIKDALLGSATYSAIGGLNQLKATAATSDALSGVGDVRAILDKYIPTLSGVGGNGIGNGLSEAELAELNSMLDQNGIGTTAYQEVGSGNVSAYL